MIYYLQMTDKKGINELFNNPAVTHKFSNYLTIWQSPTNLQSIQQSGSHPQIFKVFNNLAVTHKFSNYLTIWQSPTNFQII